MNHEIGEEMKRCRKAGTPSGGAFRSAVLMLFFNPKQGVDADTEESTNFLLLIQYDY